MASKHVKICLASQAIREMQLKKHNEITLYTHKYSYWKQKQQVLVKKWREWNPSVLLVGL